MSVEPGRPSLDYGPLDPVCVLGAYASGQFVMDELDGERANLTFESPDPRAILPLNRERVDRWKRKRQTSFTSYEYRIDTAFDEVLEQCAAPRDNDLTPFMTLRVLDMYRRLHALGFAHSIEAWLPEQGELAAATLGVSLGRAYFGESTFHRVPGSGSAVIVATMDLLIRSGFVLLDIQYLSHHFARWGAIEIPRGEYLERLHGALGPAPSAAMPPST